MNKSGISWCDMTWNPVVGCTKCATGCKNCYAEELHTKRHKAFLQGKKLPAQYAKPFGEIQLLEDRLTQPLKRKKPTTIFVNSVSDLFHENVPFEFIDRVMAAIALCPQHTFVVLTKRAERMRGYFADLNERVSRYDGGETEEEEYLIRAMMNDDNLEQVSECFRWLETWNARAMGWPLTNLWLGVSVSDQADADRLIPDLLATPAANRFVSYEPATGQVDFIRTPHVGETWDWLNGEKTTARTKETTNCINLIIMGGESGKNARPMHPDWARSTRGQCKTAGVAFYFKQWGEWGWYQGGCRNQKVGRKFVDGERFNAWMARVGVKCAGRLLDNVLHDDLPWRKP